MNHKKTIICLLLMILGSMIFMPAGAHAQTSMLSEVELPLEAENALLMEGHNEQVLYAKNAEEPVHPASITKVMTLLLAGEALEEGAISLDDTVATSLRAYEMQTGSQMFLEHEQEVSVENLIKGIAIISANDACILLAEHIAGSEEMFVQKMNERAEELGLSNTHFTNSHGLHDSEQYMSPIDIAHLANYFIRTQPEISALQAEKEWTFNNIRQYNRNPLLGTFEGVDGIKTGYLPEAGWCLAASAERDGYRLIAVVMNSETETTRGVDAQVLLTHGYTNYDHFTYAFEGEEVSEAPVHRGTEETVPLLTTSNIDVVVPNNHEEHIEKEVHPHNDIEGPIEEGTSLATMEIYYVDDLLREIELIAGEDIERQGFFSYIFSSIGGFFSSIWQGIFG